MVLRRREKAKDSSGAGGRGRSSDSPVIRTLSSSRAGITVKRASKIRRVSSPDDRFEQLEDCRQSVVQSLGKNYSTDVTVGGETETVVALNSALMPKKGSGFGCNYCYLFQYCSECNQNEYKYKSKGKEVDEYSVQSWKIGGEGDEKPVVMFVGEAPGETEDRKGRPFVGQAGEILRDALDHVNFSYVQYRIENSLLCRPPFNKSPTFAESIPCSGYLGAKIIKYRPQVIVPLGNTALRLLLGKKDAKITTWVERPTQQLVAGIKTIVYPLFHPSYILRNTHLLDNYTKSFEKLLKTVLHGHDEEDGRGTYKVLTDTDSVYKLFHKIRSEKKPTAVDIETTGLKPYAKDANIIMISFSNEYGIGYSIPLGHCEAAWSKAELQEIIERCKELLTDDSVPKVLQNGKFDMAYILVMWGVRISNIVSDTRLSHYILDENLGTHDLGKMCLKYTGIGDYFSNIDALKKKMGGHQFIPLPELGEYSAIDADVTLRLANKFDDMLKKEGGQKFIWLAHTLMPQASEYLMDMELNGARYDIEYCEKLQKKFTEDTESIMAEILTLPKVAKFVNYHKSINKKFKFSLNSTQQLSTLFLEYYNYESLKETATGADCMDKEVLQHYITKYKSDLAKMIISYRESAKLLSTYISPLLEYSEESVNPDYVYGSFNLSTTVTGRLSSSGPNLQNIPNKGAGEVKRLYITRFKNGYLMAGDLSQIELRIMAAVSGDETMIEVYKNGLDLHKRTACGIFNYTERQYNALEPKEQKRTRTIAKRVNFGIVYGIGAPGVQNTVASEGIHISMDEAQRYIDGFFALYPKAQKCISEVQDFLDANEYVESVFGRRRRLPNVHSLDTAEAARAMRQAVNMPIQSAASDMTLMSGIVLNKTFHTYNMHSCPIITIHDSILVDTYAKEGVETFDLLQEIMKNIRQYAPTDDYMWDWLDKSGVPIEVDIEVGYNWRDMVETKTSADIPASLAKSEELRKERDLP